MKHLFTLSAIVFFSLAGWTQYTRSLFYDHGGAPIYSTTIHPEGSVLKVFSVGGSTDDTLRIEYREIDSLGDVITEKSIQFLHPSVGTASLLSGSFELGNGIYTLALISKQNASTQKLFYVQIDIVSSVVINSYIPSETLSIGFSQTLLSAGNLVTYLGFAGSLSRMTVPVSNPGNITFETVDAAYSYSTPFDSGRKLFEPLIVGGTEYLIAAYSSGAKLYKRLGSSNYSNLDFGSGQVRLVDLTSSPNGDLMAAVNDSCYQINPGNFSLTASFSILDPAATNPPDGPSDLFFHGGSFYRFRRSGELLNHLTQFTSSFNYTSTTRLRAYQSLQQAQFDGNVVYLFGEWSNAGFQDHADENGMVIGNQIKAAFVTRADNFPDIELPSEYGQFWIQDDLRANLGQVGQLFVPEDVIGVGLLVNDTLKPLAFSSRSYFAGKNQSDQLVGLNRGGFGSDMIAGPYTTAGNYNSLIQSKYNRGFYVTRQMIEDHIAALASGNPNYVAPHGIREWPAHGNTSLGQAANLAPFRDSDNDGLYEPMNGDYPIIYGDRCLYSIAHHGANNPLSTHLELQSYVYGFDCGTDSVFSNTIFISHRFIARGAPLDSLYTGVFMDGDLGNFADDYAGTDLSLGLLYTYNGDLNDMPGFYGNGFRTKVPAQGLMILKGAKQLNDNLDNAVGINPGQAVNGFGFADGVIDNEFRTLESSVVFSNPASLAFQSPDNLEQNYNTLRGKFRFGDQQTACGTSIPAVFSFTDNSDPFNYATNGVDPGTTCSEFSLSSSTGDRRITGATSYTTLNVGDSTELLMAFVCEYSPAVVNSSPMDPVHRLIDKCSAIKANFAQNIGPCGNTFGPIQEDLSIAQLVEDPFTVYPNPTNGTFHVVGLTNTCQVSVYDVNGRHLSTVKMNAVENTFSLQPYAGSVFLVEIADGERMVVKRVVKN